MSNLAIIIKLYRIIITTNLLLPQFREKGSGQEEHNDIYDDDDGDDDNDNDDDDDDDDDDDRC